MKQLRKGKSWISSESWKGIEEKGNGSVQGRKDLEQGCKRITAKKDLEVTRGMRNENGLMV